MTEPTSTSRVPIHRLLVTGISGNLGRRLAPLLEGFDLYSADLHPSPPEIPAGRFHQLDLSCADGQAQIAGLIEREAIEAILHLAFVIDPLQTGIVDPKLMRRANVEATQKLLEAVAASNRRSTRVRLFVFPSSVSAYGPDLPPLVREDAPLAAHTFPYAIHKRECDETCRRFHPKLGGCALYIFRPHIFAGRTVNNFILQAMRGRASGRGWLARMVERRRWRVPILLPASSRGNNLFQFVHVDDVARVLSWTLKNYEPGQLRVLNLAGSGPPISFAECAAMFGTPIVHLPGEGTVTRVLKLFWNLGLSGVPPEALPYFLGSYTMDTNFLRETLGADYPSLIQWSSRDALADALKA
ncbi:MAG TPA: NAD-dependent epimerase/dehydratase family protein [Candidatus Acidoferrum sp.]|nr:NAD-dependent epimerase/dehydratase family protein [Candidatus Acidoferrum sp.]